MKNLTATVLSGSLIICLLSACQQTGEGPRAWIDQPLDKETFPLQALILQAHASDKDGVDTIELLVGDQTITTISTGGDRMGKALYEWIPPGTGIFTIYAQAADNHGNLGMATSSQITITDQVAQVLSDEDEEEEKEIQLAEEPEPSAIPDQRINCRGGPSADYDVLAALPADQPAEIVGRLSNSTWLVVSHPENGIACWVSASIVKVNGDLQTVRIAQAPPLPEKPPEEEQPAQPAEEEPAPPESPPETDTNPPIITSVSVSPNTIYQKGCTGDVQTTRITVGAIDIGGITSVEAAWSIGSESGHAVLNYVGANRYEATIGPINTTGTLTIYGSVVDSGGNWTPFTITATVVCCVC